MQKIRPKMFRFLDKWRYDRILHAFCINPHLCGRKNRIVQPDFLNVSFREIHSRLRSWCRPLPSASVRRKST